MNSFETQIDSDLPNWRKRINSISNSKTLNQEQKDLFVHLEFKSKMRKLWRLASGIVEARQEEMEI